MRRSRSSRSRLVATSAQPTGGRCSISVFASSSPRTPSRRKTVGAVSARRSPSNPPPSKNPRRAVRPAPSHHQRIPRTSRARRRPMMDLASTRRRSAIMAGTSARATPSRWSCAPPRCPGPTSRTRCRSRARNRKVCSSQKPGRVVELGQQVHAAGRHPHLLGQLAVGRRLHRLAVDVALAGGHFEQVGGDGGPELAHQQHPAVVEHGHHHDRPRVVDDVALEGVPRRVGEGRPGGGDQRAR